MIYKKQEKKGRRRRLEHPNTKSGGESVST